MFTVIAFDIRDDRKRARAVRTVLAHAKRVQKSVFEAADLPQAAFLRMRSLLEREIDPDTDSIRYYRLCGSCARRIEHAGAGPGPKLADPGEPTVLRPCSATLSDMSTVAPEVGQDPCENSPLARRPRRARTPSARHRRKALANRPILRQNLARLSREPIPRSGD